MGEFELWSDLAAVIVLAILFGHEYAVEGVTAWSGFLVATGAIFLWGLYYEIQTLRDPDILRELAEAEVERLEPYERFAATVQKLGGESVPVEFKLQNDEITMEPVGNGLNPGDEQ